MTKKIKQYKKFVPREISWLGFNQRVLQEAEDPSVPLIERIRFLGIYSNNLDEFYRVRVAVLKRMILMGRDMTDEFGESAERILEQVTELAGQNQRKFNQIFDKLVNELEQKNIFMLDEREINAEQAKFVKEYFAEHVRPCLVPVMLSKQVKFPYLKDKKVYLAIRLYNDLKNQKDTAYSIIQIPTDVLPRLVELPPVGNKKFLMPVDDIIRFCLHDIFSIFSYKYVEAYAIKVTRDAELEIDNDLSKSYTQKLEYSLKKRKSGKITRLVYDQTIPKELLDYLCSRLKIDEETSLIPGGGRYHNFRDFMKFPHLGHKELLYPNLPAMPHKDLGGNTSLLSVIAKKDVLLTFPYQKFSHILDILREAAIDPSVKSIKMTLYRVAENSNIAHTLLNAIKNGKEVTVVVELQARFDEENNIYWSQKLQEEGAKVIFGIPGLKVHSKLFLITRREGTVLRNYAYVGTGNFNENTSKIYTDYGLLTADPRVADEVEKVFGFLQVNYRISEFKHLLVSPFFMRKRITELVNTEIRNAKAGKPAYIWLKLNSLNDPEMIDKLYAAGTAGVKVKLIIRGVCSLVPGVKGLSENIECISIIDRFLEHSRVLLFCNGGKEKMFISSADFMVRNLDQRTEVATPVYDESIMREIKKHLEMQWKDNCKARVINEKQDNTYKKSKSSSKIRSQMEIYKHFSSKFTKN